MSKLAQLEQAGHIKLYGENSLTAGEVFFTFLGVIVMLYGHKIHPMFEGKMRTWAGIALIVFGEAIF